MPSVYEYVLMTCQGPVPHAAVRYKDREFTGFYHMRPRYSNPVTGIKHQTVDAVIVEAMTVMLLNANMLVQENDIYGAKFPPGELYDRVTREAVEKGLKVLHDDYRTDDETSKSMQENMTWRVVTLPHFYTSPLGMHPRSYWVDRTRREV